MIACTGQTCEQTLQPTHFSKSMEDFFFSTWKTIAGQPVLVHFLQPMQMVSSTWYFSVKEAGNSALSAWDCFLSAHGQRVMMTDELSSPSAQSKASLTSVNRFGLTTLTFLIPQAFTRASRSTTAVTSPITVSPVPGFSCCPVIAVIRLSRMQVIMLLRL